MDMLLKVCDELERGEHGSTTTLQNVFTCSVCGKAFSNVDNLNAHIRLMHPVHHRPQPGVREMNTNLQVPHIAPVSQNNMADPFLSNQGNSSTAFSMRGKINNNTASFSSVKSSFDSNTSAHKVVRIVNSTPEELSKGAKMYKCSECGLSSDNGKQLYTHMETHHKGFTIKRRNEERMSEISNKKTNESTLNKKKLVTILYTPVDLLQMGEKMYKCSACDLTSDEVDSLYRHMASQHKELSVKKRESLSTSLWEEMNLISRTAQTHGSCDVACSSGGVSEKKVSFVNTLGDKHQRFTIKEKRPTEHFPPYGDFVDRSQNANNDHGGAIKRVSFGDEPSGAEDFFEDNSGEEEHSHAVNDNDTDNRHYEGSDLRHGELAKSSLHVSGQDRAENNENPQASMYNDSTILHTEDKIVRIIKNSFENKLNGERPYKCSECGMASNTTVCLYRHMERKHKGFTIERLSSSIKNQNQTFPQDSTDLSHGEDRVVTILRNTFGNTLHSEPAYKCSACGKTSQHSNVLYKHMEREHKGLVIQRLLPHVYNEVEHYKESKCPENVQIIKTPADLVHKGEKLYRCSRCGLGSNDTHALYYHMASVHKEYVINRQTDFGETQSSHKDFIKIIHIINSTPEEMARGVKPYKCSECGACTMNIFEMYRHMETSHPDFVVQKFTDISVDQSAHYESNFQGELRESVSSDKKVKAIAVKTRVGIRYKCSACKTITASRSLIYKHAKKSHKDFIIEYCRGYRFKTGPPMGFRRDLQEITKSVQVLDVIGENGHQYRCSRCGIEFPKHDAALRHMRSQHKGFAILGENGLREINAYGRGEREGVLYDNVDTEIFHREKEIIESGKYVQAIRIPTDEKGNQFKCSLCNRRNKNITNLYKHMRWLHKDFPILKKSNLHGSRIELNKKIGDVGSKIKTRTVYVIRVPGVPKFHRFKCSECGQSSDCTSTLYKHMENRHKSLKIKRKSDPDQEIDENTVHIIDVPGERTHPYQCSECDKTSDDPSNLYQHMRSRHKDLRIVRKIDKRPYNQHCDKIVERLRIGPSSYMDANLYKCSECDFTSNCKADIYSHMENIHIGFTIVKKQPSALKSSIQEKNNENDDVEMICGSNLDDFAHPTSKQFESGTVHIVENTESGPNIYKCSQCNVTSDCSDTLYNHMRCMHKDFKIKETTVASDCQEGANNVDDGAKPVFIQSNIPQSGEGSFSVSMLDNKAFVIDMPAIYYLYKCSECEKTSESTDRLYRHIKHCHKDLRMMKEILFISEPDISATGDTSNNACTNNESIDRISKLKNSFGGSEKTDIINQKETSSDEDDTSAEEDSDSNEEEETTPTAGRPENSSAEGKCKTVQIIAYEKVRFTRFKCSECGKTNMNSTYLLRHMKVVHNELTILDRSDIKKMMSSCYKDNTVKIVTNPCFSSHRYKCSECDKTSESTGNLYKHMQKVHEGFRIIKQTERRKRLWNVPVNVEDFDKGSCDNDNEQEIAADEQESFDKEDSGNLKIVQVLPISLLDAHEFKCSKCDKTSDSINDLYSHMECDHKDLRIIRNPDLEERRRKFENSENPQDHDLMEEIVKKDIHITDFTKMRIHRYKCSECGMTSNSTSNLYKHMMQMHQGFVIKTKTDLKKVGITERMENDNEKVEKTVQIIDMPKLGHHQYKCSECDTTVRTAGNLYTHIKLIHKGIRIVKKTDMTKKKFSVIAKKFERTKNRKKERFRLKKNSDKETKEQTVGEGDEEELTTLDGQGNSDEEKMERTVQIIDLPKSEKFRYKCSECNTTSTATGNLYKHMRTHHKGFRIIKKTDLNKQESTSSELLKSFDEEVNGKTVEIINIGKRGQRLYKCSECGKMSDGESTSNLYRHMKTHHKGFRIIKRTERKKCAPPVRETKLSKSFDEEVNGKTVEIINIGIRGHRRYKCSECGKTTDGTSTSNLYRHMKTHHKGFRIIKRTDRKKPKLPEMDFESPEPCDKEGVERTVEIITIHRNGRRLYKCSECGKMSDGISTSNLYKHMKNHHQGFRIIKKMDIKGKKKKFAWRLRVKESIEMPVEGRKKKSIALEDIKSFHEEESIAEESASCENADGPENIDVPSVCGEEQSSFAEDSESSDDEERVERYVEIVDIPKVGTHQYKCSECDMTSSDSSDLYKHMKLQHKDFTIKKKRTDSNGKMSESCQDNGASVEHIEIPDFDDDDDESSFDGVNERSEKTVKVITFHRSGIRLYKCSECGKTSEFTGNLYRHMRKYHQNFRIIRKTDINGKKKESDCSRSVKDNNDIMGADAKKKSVTSDEERIKKPVYVVDIWMDGKHLYKCSECYQVCTTTGNLYNHMRNHHRDFNIVRKIDLDKVINESCKDKGIKMPDGGDDDSSDEREDDKTVEIITVHRNGKRLYKCSECGKMSDGNSTSNLYRHMKMHHKGLRIIKKMDMKRKKRKYLNRCSVKESIETPGEGGNEKSFAAEDSKRSDEGESIRKKNDKTSASGENEDGTDNIEIPYDCYEDQSSFAEDPEHSDDEERVERYVEIIDIPKVGMHQYKCSECDMTSSVTSDLYKHMKLQHKDFTIRKKRTDVNEKMSEFCKDKGAGLLESSDEEGVEKTVEIITVYKNGKRLYKCSECGKMSDGNSTSNLYIHMKMHHKGFRILKKMDIKRKMRQNAYRRREMPDFVDDDEESSFAGKHESSDEERSEKTVEVITFHRNGVRLYKCSECGKTSEFTGNLYKHMRNYHQGLRIIQKINIKGKKRESFGSNSVNDSNEIMGADAKKKAVTSDEERIKKPVCVIDIWMDGKHLYKCSECYQVCTTTGNLYNHMRNHHRDFKIITKTDGKGSKERSMSAEKSVSSDEETNGKTVKIINIGKTGKHPYKCSECDKTSGGTGNLYKHMKRYHKGFKIIRKINTKGKTSELNSRAERVTKNTEISDDDEIDQSSGAEEFKKSNKEPDGESFQISESGHRNSVSKGSGTVQVITLPKGSRRRYKCSECDRINDSTGSLYRHMERKHKKLRIIKKTVQIVDLPKTEKHRYKCSECEMASNSTGHLYKHMKLKHKNHRIVLKTTLNTQLKELIYNGIEKSNRTKSMELLRNQNKQDDENNDTMSNDENESNASPGNTLRKFDDVVEVHHLPSRISSYECCECMEIFASVDELDNHVVSHHDEESDDGVNCDMTNSEDEPENESGHVEGVVFVRDLKKSRFHNMKCSKCNLTSNNSTILYVHMMKKHKGFKIVKRPVGKRSFRRVMNPGRPFVHIVNIPPVKVHRYKCSECDRTSDSIPTLHQHMKISHKGLRIGRIGGVDNLNDKQGNQTVQVLDLPKMDRNGHRYKCSECDQTASHTANLYKHMQNHHRYLRILRKVDKRKIKMMEMVTEFDKLNDNESSRSTVEILDLPKRDRNGHRYKCSECDETALQTTTLYKHMQTHHRHLRILNKVDKRKVGMLEMVTEFDKLNENECSVDKQDNRPTVEALDLLKIDQNGHKYKCSECGKTARDTTDLYKHMQNNHKDLKILKQADKRKMKVMEMVTEWANSSGGNASNSDKHDDLEVTDEIECEKERGIQNLNRTDLAEGNIDDCEEGGVNISSTGNKMDIEFSDYSESENCEQVENLKTKIGQIVANEKVTKDYAQIGLDMHTKGEDADQIDEVRLTEAGDQKENDETDKEKTFNADLGCKTIKVIDISDNGNKLYKCSECDERSKSSSDIERHMRREHRAFQIEYRKFLDQQTKGVVDDFAENIENTDDEYDPGESDSDSDGGNESSGDEGIKVTFNQSNTKTESESASRVSDTNLCNDASQEGNKSSTTVRNERVSDCFKDDESTKTVQITSTLGNGKKQYQCSLCSFVCDNASFIDDHTRRKHTGVKIIEEKSHRGMTLASGDYKYNEGDKTVHARRVLRNGEFLYKCSLCNYSCETIGAVYMHMRKKHRKFNIIKKKSELERIPTEYSESEEDVDNDATETVEVLDLDNYSCENRKERYKCSRCDKISETVTHLYEHMRENHSAFKIIKRTDIFVRIVDIPDTGNGRYKCSDCDKTSFVISNLYKHMRSKHKRFRILKKALINEKLRNGGSQDCVRVLNLIPNEGSYLYKCSKCDERGETIALLYNHIRSSHIGLTMVKRNGDMEIISAESENEQPKIAKVVEVPNEEQRYKCSVCSYAQASLDPVYEHIRHVHKDFKILKHGADSDDDDVFSCSSDGEIDDETPIQTVEVLNGDVDENGIQRYKCSRCAMTSVVITRLYKHMRREHRGFKIMKRSDVSIESDLEMQESKSDIDLIIADQMEESSEDECTITVKAVDVPGTAANNWKKQYKCSLCFMLAPSTGVLYKHMRCMHKHYKIKKRKFQVRSERPEHTVDRQKDIDMYLRFKDDLLDVDSDDSERDSQNTLRTPSFGIGGISSYECCLCMDMFSSSEDLDFHIYIAHKIGKKSNRPSIFDYDKSVPEVDMETDDP